MRQKKILFVVDYLGQYGAERYLFEIIKVLVEQGASVVVYSVVELHDNYRYYIKHIEDLGVKVWVLPDSLYPDVKNHVLKKILNSFTYRLINKIVPRYVHNKLENNLIRLANDYDIVSIIKWDLYNSGIINFDKINNKKIHIMGGLAQYSVSPYKVLPKEKVDFVVYYKEQIEEILNGREANDQYNFYNIPLLIENEKWPNLYNPLADGKLRIGVFSRIHYDQPTIFALAVVAQLKEQGIPVELYFFGKYFDQNFYEHYLKTVEILKIHNEVKFMGHTQDIGASIKDNFLNIGIMNSLGPVVGYSSIELQSYGLPVVFFNINKSDFSNTEFPFVCNTVSEMVQTVKELWLQEGRLEKLSNTTFLYAKNAYGTKNNVDKVIDVFLK